MKIIFSQTTRICRSCEWQLLSDAKESRNDPVPAQNSAAPDFDFETFRVIAPCTALYTVVRIATNKDYDRVEEIFDFLREERYEICGNVLARTIANCYCDRESTEYVEIWAPVKKQEE